MTFDESNAKLTDHLTGRVIDHIVRNGKCLEFVCTDGHSVMIQSDVNGDIHFKSQSVKIIVPPVRLFGDARL